MNTALTDLTVSLWPLTITAWWLTQHVTNVDGIRAGREAVWERREREA